MPPTTAADRRARRVPGCTLRRSRSPSLHPPPHPTPPSPANSTQPGIILLREGTDQSQGKAQLISNINACQVRRRRESGGGRWRRCRWRWRRRWHSLPDGVYPAPTYMTAGSSAGRAVRRTAEPSAKPHESHDAGAGPPWPWQSARGTQRPPRCNSAWPDRDRTDPPAPTCPLPVAHLPLNPSLTRRSRTRFARRSDRVAWTNSCSTDSE